MNHEITLDGRHSYRLAITIVPLDEGYCVIVNNNNLDRNFVSSSEVFACASTPSLIKLLAARHEATIEKVKDWIKDKKQ